MKLLRVVAIAFAFFTVGLLIIHTRLQNHDLSPIPAPVHPTVWKSVGLDARTTANHFLTVAIEQRRADDPRSLQQMLPYDLYAAFARKQGAETITPGQYSSLLRQVSRTSEVALDSRRLSERLVAGAENDLSVKLTERMHKALVALDSQALSNVLLDAELSLKTKGDRMTLPLLPLAKYVYNKLVIDTQNQLQQMRDTVPDRMEAPKLAVVAINTEEGVRVPSPAVAANTPTPRPSVTHATTAAPTQHKSTNKLSSQPRVMDPGSFPIGVVAYNRVAELRRCLTSLLRVDGFSNSTNPPQVTVYQDGTDPGPAGVARSFAPLVRLVQRPNIPNDRNKEGAMKIADHYKFTLSSLFRENSRAEYVIVVEDDMIFSPDFLLFFAKLAYLYEADPTIYCISSWNDNGREGLVADPSALYRTEFFIGLGWMVSKKIFIGELEAVWPAMHWDHWLRQPNQRKGRECVYPEVSRNYNIGKQGTHTDNDMFDRYFATQVLNTQHDVDLGDTARMITWNYEKGLEELLAGAQHVKRLKHLADLPAGSTVAVYYQASGPDDEVWEKEVAPYFGLWHSIPFIRGAHKGLMQFRFNGHLILLVASYSPYVRYKPDDVPLMTRKDFGKAYEDLDSAVQVVTAAPDQGCDRACAATGLRCSLAAMPYLNNCEALTAHFKCAACDYNYGTDQPAYVSDPDNQNFDQCLMNTAPFTCNGKHPATRRLCPCVEPQDAAA